MLHLHAAVFFPSPVAVPACLFDQSSRYKAAQGFLCWTTLCWASLMYVTRSKQSSLRNQDSNRRIELGFAHHNRLLNSSVELIPLAYPLRRSTIFGVLVSDNLCLCPVIILCGYSRGISVNNVLVNICG